MIEAISESTVQQTTRVEHTLAENQRSVAANETERTAVERPVEKPSDGKDAKNGAPKDQSRTRYNIDNNKLIIEQYGKNGELLLQLPAVHCEDV